MLRSYSPALFKKPFVPRQPIFYGNRISFSIVAPFILLLFGQTPRHFTTDEPRERKDLPKYCPYFAGSRLVLNFLSDVGTMPGQNVSATIIEPFLPFTQSEAMKVRIHSSSTALPKTLVLKLFDRRFVERAPGIERPWKPSVEIPLRRVIEDVKTGIRPKDDDFNSSYDKWEDWKHEIWVESRLLEDRDRECMVYRHLAPLQGTSIPRFYGAFRCYLEGEEQDPVKNITGLALEFVDGIPIDGLQIGVNISEDAAEHMSQSALAIMRELRHYQVLHRDIRSANLLIQSSDQSPVLIDFAGARIREKKLTDEEWTEVVTYAEEIHQMRLLLERRKVHEPTPFPTPDPHPLLGHMLLNMYVGDGRRSDGWRKKHYESIELDGPEAQIVYNEKGEEFGYFRQRWRLKPGVRTTEGDRW